MAIVCSYTVSLVNFRFPLLKAMVENGHESLLSAPNTMPQPSTPWLNRGFLRPIPMARAGFNPFEDLRTLAALWAALRKLKPDVILCYTMKPIITGSSPRGWQA